ncbi:MAG: hypothetical protein ACRERU_05960, partial [Methylococcales bacterium]
MVPYSIRYIVIPPLLILFLFNAARAEPLDAELPNMAEGVREPGIESIQSKLAEIKAEPSL